MKRIVLALTCMIGASTFVPAHTTTAGPTTGNGLASAATDMHIAASQPVSVEALPAAVIFTLANSHPGARIVSVYLIEGNESKLYRVVLTLGDGNTMTLFVNCKGEIIKQ